MPWTVELASTDGRGARIALDTSKGRSLDGFIAGPDGEYDWIPLDPDIDFAAMYAAYGAIVMGRKSTPGEEVPPQPVKRARARQRALELLREDRDGR